MIYIPNVDEQIALENYVREQRLKGYKNEELRVELRKVGWDKKFIEEILKNTKSESSDLIGLNKYAKYDKYIKDDEIIKSVYSISTTKLILTNERLIVIKFFPKVQIKIDYKNIEYVEYFTNIYWRYLFISLGCIFAFLFIFSFHDNLSVQLQNLVPFLAPILTKKVISQYNIFSFILSIVFICSFLIIGWKFVDSLFGRLRITIKDQAPVDIISKLTTQVQSFIKEMETLEANNKNNPNNF